MNGYAAEALNQVEAVLAESGLDEEIYNATQSAASDTADPASLVASGLTNAQIGERMYRSRHAIDFPPRQIVRKLGITTRHQLARLAVGHHGSWPDE